MSAGKHTKGPWGISKAIEIWVMAGPVHVATIPRAGDSDWSEANAALIAAAPETAAERDRLKAANADLLAVARRILDRGYVSKTIEEERGDHLALVAAIAKAEGRSDA